MDGCLITYCYSAKICVVYKDISNLIHGFIFLFPFLKIQIPQSVFPFFTYVFYVAGMEGCYAQVSQIFYYLTISTTGTMKEIDRAPA